MTDCLKVGDTKYGMIKEFVLDESSNFLKDSLTKVDRDAAWWSKACTGMYFMITLVVSKYYTQVGDDVGGCVFLLRRVL